jgi:predicted  nucleic acid-binding Zn-ribbon protein
MNIAQLDQTIAELQKTRNQIAQLGDLQDKIAKATLQSIALNEELEQARSKSETEIARLRNATAAAEQQHLTAMATMKRERDGLANEIRSTQSKLDAVEQKTAARQEHHDMILRSIDALRDRLKVA